MRIGVNFLSFRSYQGTETVAANLVRGLVRFDSGIEYLIFASHSTPPEMRISGKKTNIVTVAVNPANNLKMGMYQQIILPFKLISRKVDLFYAPLPSVPILYPGHKIITIHDCAYDRFPEFKSYVSRLYIKLMYAAAKYWCNIVITDSAFSRDELIRLYRIKPEKIKIIYHGVPALPDTDSILIEDTKKFFNIKDEYLLYVGITRPRKNIPGLLKAFKIFTKKHKNIQLVLAGRKDNGFVNISGEINRLALDGHVIQTDFISESQKAALYRGAVALVFPSYYEGFGLPVIEAQSLGIPVVTSNISSLPEISGNGALHVDPYNIEDIAGGMERMLDSSLRKELIEKGYENIKRFSWEASARKLLDIFKALS